MDNGSKRADNSEQRMIPPFRQIGGEHSPPSPPLAGNVEFPPFLLEFWIFVWDLGYLGSLAGGRARVGGRPFFVRWWVILGGMFWWSRRYDVFWLGSIPLYSDPNVPVSGM